MRIAPDTNVLVRAIIGEESEQARAARTRLAEAEAIFLTLPALCETAWVLKSHYGASREALGTALRALTGAANTHFDEPAVSVGLDLLDAGGDFADGVIAAAGFGMGAETFVSFDQSALKRLHATGFSVEAP